VSAGARNPFGHVDPSGNLLEIPHRPPA
jgi:hypothetical protein